MNYKAIYKSLMTSRKDQTKNSNQYTEVHHIVPKCLGGTNDLGNLVVLTYREHYLAHWLLTKIYPNNSKLLWAFSLMDGKLSPLSNRQTSSVQYARCKKALQEASRLKFLTDNPTKNPILIKKISENMKGDNNPLRKYPHRNRTAYPVNVVFKDGTSKSFSCGKYAQEKLGIPKATWKYWIKHGVNTKKYDIAKIEKLTECEG